jgi:hypothetical protein
VALDERLKQELERAGRPADPSGVYEELIRRRERRRIARRAQSALVAVVVLAGSVGGFYALTQIFRGSEAPDVATPLPSGEIVFSIPLEGEGEALMAVSPDGSGLRQLTPDGSADYRSPDVSPDGRLVVVVHSIPSFEGEMTAVLATVPIEGGSPTWLTNEPQIVDDPVWSPDGKSIAFVGDVPDGPYGVYVLDVTTGDTQLVPGTEDMLTRNPTWSPSGNRLAFEGDVPEPPDDGPGVIRDGWDIYVVRPDGSELTNVTRTPDESEVEPAWSWETDRIAFIRGVPRGLGLYAIAPDGSDETLVFDGLPNLASPAWSPDGTAIAFSADTGQVYTIPVSGGEPAAVPGALGEPAWQTIPEGAIVEQSPSVSPSPREGEDIGLGFPVCNVTSVAGEFAPGVDGTAFVATKIGDTGDCRRSPAGFQVLAVDVSGDGLADASYGPLDCEEWCNVWAAPDVDGDGTDELLIQNIQFTINGLHLYDVRTDPAAIVQVTVASPGDGDLFPAGHPPQLWFGGDGFNSDSLGCSLVGGIHPVFISSTASQRPPESGPWHVHETTFTLVGRQLEVVGARDYETTGDLLPRPENGRICGGALPLPWSELY